MKSDSPLFVQVTRGQMVESRHRVTFAVLDADGKIIAAKGDIDRPIYGRSAIKPLLALPLVESGAADAFGLDDRHIALACASHNGEARQVDLVLEWLTQIGLSSKDLECGAQAPSFKPDEKKLILEGKPFGCEHNNCSGKHSGFLSTALHKGDPTKNYIQYEHPVQQRLLTVLEDMSGLDLKGVPRGVDGCGIPVIAIPTRHHALAMAKLASGKNVSPDRAQAALRITRSMMEQPYYVAGTKRYCTDFMQSFPGKAAVKVGAEGVYCAALPAQGWGICLKVEDGATRAAETALSRILRDLGILSAQDEDAHPELFQPPLKNWVGTQTGSISADPAF